MYQRTFTPDFITSLKPLAYELLDQVEKQLAK